MATEREERRIFDWLPFKLMVNLLVAVCWLLVRSFSLMMSLEWSERWALVVRRVELMPEIWVVSISMVLFGSRWMIVVGFKMRLPEAMPSP